MVFSLTFSADFDLIPGAGGVVGTPVENK